MNAFLRKEFFLAPVGTRVCHPPELQRGRAVGPRFLKSSFLERSWTTAPEACSVASCSARLFSHESGIPPRHAFLCRRATGCANADFTPYVGAQQNWPIAGGAFVSNRYIVPAYYGLPPGPYVALGYLDATTAPVRRRGVVEFGARRSKEIGGDAIIV